MSRRSLACVLGGGLALALGFGVNTPASPGPQTPPGTRTSPSSRRAPARCSASATSTPKPAGPRRGHEGHGGAEHFCRFNNAFQVNKGNYGPTKLDGAKFWVAGDLGDDFSNGEMDWAVAARSIRR